MPTLTERSVIDMGQGSYIITLPRAWVRYYGLKPGDKLQVIADGELTIYPPTQHKEKEAKATD